MNRLILAIVITMATMISCSERSADNHTNPLLEEWDTPFGIAPFEKIKPDHYIEAFEVAIAEQRKNIELITSDDTPVEFGSVVAAIDGASHRLLDLKDLFEMSEMAISDDDWVRVSELVKPRISEAMDSMWMNEALFSRVSEIYGRRKSLALTEVESRLLDRTYQRFVRGGAELNDELKSELAGINSEIVKLSSRYSSNLMAENRERYIALGIKELDGLPSDVKSIAKIEAERRGLKDRWVFGMNSSSIIPFLTYSDNREMRDSLYHLFVTRCSEGEYDNGPIVKEVTRLRQRRAEILGYKNHAEYVISEQMAGSASAAYELLNKLWQPALEGAERERMELTKIFQQKNPGEELKPWDWWYYTEVRRARELSVSSDALRVYFTIENVRGGAMLLANRLYGLSFRPVAVPMYDDTCTAYEVLDKDGSHLGVLYFDLYARDNKEQGAWCGNLREQRTDGGDRITPVVAIVCNFPTEPNDSAPSQLSLEQVETLFHEFGHALHFIFQDVDYRGLAAVEGDFVEFPSQVMENWAFEPALLRQYAVSFRNSQVISDEQIEKIHQMREFNQGFECVTITAAALLDLDLQCTTDLDNFNCEEFEHEALVERRGLIDAIAPRYYLRYFPHLFTYDYSAGYYFYLWAEVLDKDCFAHFKSSGDIFSQTIANRLRHEILERGGEESGATLYRNFRGAEPTEEAMLRSRGLWVEPEPTEEEINENEL